MEKICFCCKKNIEDFLPIDLADASICDECFKKVNTIKERITHRNIGMYSAEEIMNILNSAEKTSQPEASSPSIEEKPQVIENTQPVLNENNNHTDDDNHNKGESFFGIIKKIGWTMVAIILFICLINPTFLEEIAMKLLGANDSQYIEMVQELRPFDSTSYYDAFESEFDSNEWSYFKSGDEHIVQVISTYNDIDEKMTTQFLLTPQGNDQFYIEPYSVNVGGKNLTTLEITMVMSRIFKGDLSEAIFEALLFGN